MTWDVERLKTTLENWPCDTIINYTTLGREHGIQGGNAGQVVKEFAQVHNINLTASTPKRRPNRRPCKKRLTGSGFDVAVPSNPPLATIDKHIDEMVESGRFSLGEECDVENHVLVRKDTQVHGRKLPLKVIRQHLLTRHAKYMRPSTTTIERSLCLWHDHATLLKHGYLLITVHVMYDHHVYYTDEEYQQLHPESGISVEAEVEQPEVHIFAAGSSSAEDQVALVGDRMNCLFDLQAPIQTEGGVTVSDTMRYFTGDHPAAQFEQGSKQGGYFKCGACGCKSTLYNDQAHVLVRKWRLLEQLCSIAVGGVFGIRPFQKLTKDDIRRELRARGVPVDDEMKKDELHLILDNTLRGVARVPALLITNPAQSLQSLGLQRYEVVANEPLHDLK